MPVNIEMEKLIFELKQIHKQIEKCKSCTTHFYHYEDAKACMHHLDNLTAKNYTKKDINAVLKNKNLQKTISAIREFWNTYETQGEFEHAQHLLKGNAEKNIQNYALFDSYAIFIRQEGTMAKLKKEEHVLFFGSGPLPLSAILLTQIFGVTVHCIDSCPDCITLSRKIIRKLGLTKKIKISKGDARTFKLKGYDAIWLAALTRPKEAILHHLATAPPATRIIIRKGEGLRSLFYEPIDSTLLKKFSNQKQAKAKGNIKPTSLLLQPK